MNSKGGLFDLVVLMIVAFVAILFFAGWIFAHNLLTDKLLEAGAQNDNSNINITDAANKTFVLANNAMPQLTWVAFAIIFGMTLAILVSNFLVRANPIFVVPYILFTIIAIIFSAYISNAYEDLLSNQLLGPTLQTFTASNYFMLYLPFWITIIGLIGGITLFIGVTADRDLGGSII